MCKFTPLGFETLKTARIDKVHQSVNLPRWGLKQFLYRQPSKYGRV